jgi:hypothetical protein
MKVGIGEIREARELVSGQWRNPNVSHLELQPVTCDRVSRERGLFPAAANQQLCELFDLCSQRITSFSLSFHHFGRFATHGLTFPNSLLSLHPLSLKSAPLQPSTHTPSLIPRPVSLFCPSNLLEVLSASQTFGLSPLLREWLHKPYTTSTPSNAFCLSLSTFPADWTRVKGPKIAHIKVFLAPIPSP